MTEFLKWPSINRFSDVYVLAERYQVDRLVYNAKIKLHGTNAGIRVMPDGSLQAQKRSGDITINDDNAGFARFVADLDVIVDPSTDVVIYGEWAGRGVQKGDAVCNVDRAFFVFSAVEIRQGIKHVYNDPDEIASLLIRVFGYIPDGFHVIPWFYSTDIEVNVSDQTAAQEFVDRITSDVDQIGQEDPYIKSMFGVSGPGEGLVFYLRDGIDFESAPVDLHAEVIGNYMFKHKTEAHTVNKSKSRNHVAPEKPAGIDEFVDMFATEGRFQQMVDDNGLEFDRKNTGLFIKAVMKDIHKESVNEIAAAEFDWKDAAKYLPDTVRAWWQKKCEEI